MLRSCLHLLQYENVDWDNLHATKLAYFERECESCYLRIQLCVPSNRLGVIILVSEATEAAQYALLSD